MATGAAGLPIEVHCPPAILSFIESVKKEIDSLKNFIVYPPNPTRNLSASLEEVRDMFYMAPVVIWAPELFFSAAVPRMPCPTCKSNSCVVSNGWGDPRPVVDFRQLYWIVAKRYKSRCPGGGTFIGYDPDVMALLPEFVSLQFPCQLTRKGAIDNGLLWRLNNEATSTQSFSGLSASLDEVYKSAYYR